MTGASGGVGSSVVKIAKSRAARVMGVYRQAPGPEKTKLLGVDLTLSTQSDDVVNRVKEFTGDKGSDIAFDTVGSLLFGLALSSSGMGGRQVNIASTGERRVSFDFIDFYRRQVTLMGLNTISWDSICLLTLFIPFWRKDSNSGTVASVNVNLASVRKVDSLRRGAIL